MSIFTLTQTLFLWVVAMTFLFSGWNKLHILWAAPLALVSVYIVLAIPVLGHVVGLAANIFGTIVSIGARRSNYPQ